MMRRLLLLAALATAPAVAPAAAKPALWAVRDGGNEITLYGTVHALPPGIDWLSPVAAQRLDAADSLVVEAVIPQDRFAIAATVTQLGIRDGLPPLAKRVPAAVALRIAPAAASAGIPILTLDRMKTWLAAVTLSQSALEAQGLSSASGVEPALTARARAGSKPVIGLETVDQQLRYFDTLPAADQTALLTATLDDLKDIKGETDRLVRLWQAGDVDTIARDFAREARASPTLERVLLVERNARWANWIGGVLKQPGRIFIAVGAGHFGGPNGLIAMLKARGLTVERVE